MGKETGIEWTHHTFNPWRGCVKVSPACQHCYAETWAKRTGKPIWGQDAEREFASESYWRQPLKWDADARAAGERRRVFCSSLADVGEDRLDLVKPRERLMRLIRQTQNLDWLLLTKRPENMERFFNWNRLDHRFEPGDWPRNIWVGTTAENQEWADRRIPHLLKVRSSVRFLSVEPMLGFVDIKRFLNPPCQRCSGSMSVEVIGGGAPCPACLNHQGYERGVDWVICGGESGPGARPMHPNWARYLRDQCRLAVIPFLFKQWGNWVAWRPEHDVSGVIHLSAADGKSGSQPAYVDGDSRPRSDTTPMVRMSAKADAGRTLDGREWSEYPMEARV